MVATYLDQEIFHARSLPVILFSGPYRVYSRTQDLDGTIEIRPSRNLLLCFFDVTDDQFVVCAVVRVDLKLLYLCSPGRFSRVSLDSIQLTLLVRMS
jgi:hypothetical protein